MKLVISDLDGTLEMNNNIGDITVKLINEFTKENKFCIVTDSTYNEIKLLVKNYNLDCDYYSTFDGSYNINNKEFINLINKDLINNFIETFEDSIYTSFNNEENSTIFKFQERLKAFYPKTYNIGKYISKDTKSYMVSFNVKNKIDVINYLKSNNLTYSIYGEDKNRVLLNITSIKLTKENSVSILKSVYKPDVTIGITDSFSDYPMLELCDIKIAMKNGDDELKEKVDYITSLPAINDGAMLFINDICHLKKI